MTTLLLLVGVPEDHLGAVHVGLDRADRLSTISLTPTAAARWKTTSHRRPARRHRLVRDGVDGVWNPGCAFRCSMFSIEPVDRSSSM